MSRADKDARFVSSPVAPPRSHRGFPTGKPRHRDRDSLLKPFLSFLMTVILLIPVNFPVAMAETTVPGEDPSPDLAALAASTSVPPQTEPAGNDWENTGVDWFIKGTSISGNSGGGTGTPQTEPAGNDWENTGVDWFIKGTSISGNSGGGTGTLQNESLREMYEADSLIPHGCLVLYPANGDSGTLDNTLIGTSLPQWAEFSPDILSVSVKAGVASGTSISGAFAGLGQCTNIDLSGLDVSAALDASGLFDGCTALGSMSIPASFDSSSVENMDGMFYGCISLLSLDLTHLSTKSALSMGAFFNGCENLGQVCLGASFSFGGASGPGTVFCSLPPGATGSWVGPDGATVYAAPELAASYDGSTMAGLYSWEGSVSYTGVDYFVKGVEGSARNSSPEGISGLKNQALRELYENDPTIENGTLVLYPASGVSGVLANSSSTNDVPWIGDPKILKVKVAPGVKTGAEAVGLFSSLTSCTSIDLRGLDTSNTVNLEWFFSNTPVLEMDASCVSTTKAQNTGYMFAGCSNLQSIDISGFSMAGVQTCFGMFASCSSLVSLDLSSWHLPDNVGVGEMFAGCSSLEYLDLTPLDTAVSQDLSTMFAGCNELKTMVLGEKFSFSVLGGNLPPTLPTPPSTSPYTGKWISPAGVSYTSQELAAAYNGTTMAGVYQWEATAGFSGVDWFIKGTSVSGNSGGGTSFLQNVAAKRQYELDTSISTGTLVIYPADGTQGTMDSFVSPTSVPWYKYRDTIAAVKAVAGVSLGSSAVGLFYQFSNCATFSLGGLNTEATVDYGSMFSGCSSVTEMWLYFNTSKAVNMKQMFYSCSRLVSLTMLTLDFSKVENLGWAFANCSSLKRLDVKVFNTSSAKTMQSMFEGCSSLPSIKTGGMETQNATNISNMFNGCSSLDSLDLSSFDTSKMTSMSDAFSGCDLLSSVTLGAKFSFKGGGETVLTTLNTPSLSLPYYGEWNLSTAREQHLAPMELAESYDGATMAGEYEWSKKGKVTFSSADGSIIYQELYVPIGSPAIYTGAIPVKPSTSATTYSFVGWVLWRGSTQPVPLDKITDLETTVYPYFEGDVDFTVTIPTAVSYESMSVGPVRQSVELDVVVKGSIPDERYISVSSQAPLSLSPLLGTTQSGAVSVAGRSFESPLRAESLYHPLLAGYTMKDEMVFSGGAYLSSRWSGAMQYEVSLLGYAS